MTRALPTDGILITSLDTPASLSLDTDINQCSQLDKQATLLALPGTLLITSHPELQQQLTAIQELQFRQDEMHQDFSLAIHALLEQLRVSG